MIPKIIHQIWIGTNPEPTKFMKTWEDKNPHFEYIKWNEQEVKKRGKIFECQKQINEMEEMCGKADIMRWEILYEYGGIAMDADSICIEKIDEVLYETKGFLTWENEQCRQGLLAVGIMAFPPKHELVKNAIENIKNKCVSVALTKKRAWQTTGPCLLTEMYNKGNYKELVLLPSYSFLPIHYTKLEYKGHGKVYAYQEWGSSKQNYNIMNKIELPIQFTEPNKEDSISILISSLNTKAIYLQQCLESIKHQSGHFNIEIIWINDGSDEIHSVILKKLLNQFEKTTRFTEVKYYENDNNIGIGKTLNKGILLCSHEIIIKMDSDDIMVQDRIIKQYNYMKNNKNVMICGGQINMFNNQNQTVGKTNHKSLTWEEYKKSKSHWIMNHPTLCYRKSAIIEVGNYNETLNEISEDFELELRVLKKYNYIHNFQEVLLNYRMHDNQITKNHGKKGKQHWHDYRNKLIESLIN